jgi:hypothetical protein
VGVKIVQLLLICPAAVGPGGVRVLPRGRALGFRTPPSCWGLRRLLPWRHEAARQQLGAGRPGLCCFILAG